MHIHLKSVNGRVAFARACAFRNRLLFVAISEADIWEIARPPGVSSLFLFLFLSQVRLQRWACDLSWLCTFSSFKECVPTKKDLVRSASLRGWRRHALHRIEPSSSQNSSHSRPSCQLSWKSLFLFSISYVWLTFCLSTELFLVGGGRTPSRNRHILSSAVSRRHFTSRVSILTCVGRDLPPGRFRPQDVFGFTVAVSIRRREMRTWFGNVNSF